MSAENPTPTPDELLQTKEDILEQWRKLPGDHQATMLLVLLHEIQSPTMIEWTKDAISFADRSEPTIATPERLARLPLDEELLATLTASDLRNIESRIRSSFDHDEFWDELLLQALEYPTEQVLREKRQSTD